MDNQDWNQGENKQSGSGGMPPDGFSGDGTQGNQDSMAQNESQEMPGGGMENGMPGTPDGMPGNGMPGAPDGMPQYGSLSASDGGRYGMPSVPADGGKKKTPKWLPAVLAVAGAAVIILVVASLFALGVLGASPAKKYAKLQDEWMTKGIRNGSDVYNTGYEKKLASAGTETQKMQQAVNYALRFSLSPEMGELLGIMGFDNMELSGTVFGDSEQGMRILTDYILNDSRLFTTDMMAAFSEGMAFLGIPDLSEEYLSAAFESYVDYEGTMDLPEDQASAVLSKMQQDPFPADKLEIILTDLKDIWVAHSPKEIEVEKNAAIEQGGISVKANRYVASYSQGELQDCLVEMVKYVRDQKDLQEYAVRIGLCTAEEYLSAFEDLLEDTTDLDEEERKKEAFSLTFGANKKDIVLFEMKLNDSEGSKIAWIQGDAEKGKDSAWIIGTDASYVQIRHKRSEGANGQDGTLTLGVKESGIMSEIEVAYTGYSYDAENGLMKLDADINSELFSGLSLGLTIDETKEKQKLEIELLLGNISMGTMTAEISPAEFQPFTFPKSYYNMEDERQMNGYLLGCDLKGFVNNLLSNQELANLLMQFGVDPERLKEEVLNSADVPDGSTGIGGADLPEEEEGTGGSGSDDGQGGESGNSGNGESGNTAGGSGFSSYKGYEADESGWVYFEPDSAEIITIGKGSTGYESFEDVLVDEEMLGKLDGFAQKIYGSGYQYDGEQESNSIYGQEPNVASYYSKIYGWSDSADEYANFFMVSFDSVTKQLQAAELYGRDMESALSQFGDLAEALTGTDAAVVIDALRTTIDEGNTYISAGGLDLYWYDMEEGCVDFYFSPAS